MLKKFEDFNRVFIYYELRLGLRISFLVFIYGILGFDLEGELEKGTFGGIS